MDEITESLFEELSNPHLPLALTHHRVKQRRKQCSRTTDLLLNKYDILSTLSYTEDVFPIPIIPECHASVLPKESVAFSKCISSHNHDRLVHFYEPDTNFIRILHNPKKYGPILKRYPVVVGPDFSQKVGYAPFVNFENSWWNKALTAYFVSFGVQMIPNVSWSTPMSYFYAFSGIPKHSTIAINSNGILSNSAAVYLWRKGYEEALRVLEPTLVVRYGDKIPGENANISVYYENMNLKYLRNGR